MTIRVFFLPSKKNYLVYGYLLNSYYVTLSGNKDPAVNQLDKIPALTGVYSLREDRKCFKYMKRQKSCS